METKFLEGMKAARLPKEEVIREAIAAQRLQSDQLDDLMRREFSLYASQATQNGYGFQAHLIRTKVTPSTKTVCMNLKATRGFLTRSCQPSSTRITLHAIPLKIITDKELSSSEMIMVLDYIVISAADILKAIKDFSYPGQTRVIDTE
jgi:hypothetical protein